MSDRIKTLYGQLVRNGYDLGGYEKFNAAMHDSNRRRSLYNQLVANRADLGGYEKFSSVVETAPRTAPSAPQKKSDFVADTINMLRTPSSQYTRPQPSKAAGTFEMPSKYDIYHNMPDAVKRHQTPTPLKPEAVMPSVPSNAAESVWAAADKAESADVREKVDEGWSWRKIMQALSSGASVTGGLGDDNAQALETTSVAHLKTHDLQKLSDQAWAALGTKQQQSIINDTYRYLKEQYPDADDKALVDAARKMARAKSDEQMYNLAVEKNMPKSVGEFFLRKAAAASSFGSLSKGYASMMAGTRGDMEAEDTALQKYGSKHKVADIAGSVAGFAVDPLTYAAGGVGGAATKVALWTGGKVLSEAAARKMSQTLGGKLLLGAIGGAANFGTFEAGGEALNQYKWGGTLDVDPETGRYVVGDFSLGKVASQLRHGLAMGGLTGAFGTWLGNVSTRAAQATSSTLGKLGVRTGELGVGLVGEGTIFATPEFISTYGDYNDVIKSVSDKNSPNYIADDKERSKYIAEIKAQRGERMMDIWQDNLAMIAGFKAQHAIKSAGRTISELAASRRGKVGFVERMGRMLDGHPSLALSKEEQTELDKHGYGDLTQMVKEYKTYAQKDGDLPYNKITQLLNDKNVSEAARAKMYYYVTGHTLPMSAVIASNVIDNGDKTYTVQSLGDNGVITSRTYESRKRADYEKSRIDRQAELNGVAMAEQMFDNMDRAERLKAVCTRLAQDKGVSPETLLWLTRKDPKQMTAAEKRWVKEIEDAANEDAPQGENATVRHIKGVIFDEYGVDVDKALRKAADSRTEAEKSAISAYNNELAQAVAERKNAISQGETTDAYRRGYEADTQGMRDAYVAQMYEPSEDNAETLKGVETQITESAKYQAALEREELKQMTHKDGSTHLATLKEKDKDGNGKQVYIVDGDIVMKEDGSGIDADASSKSVIIYDPATGEKKMVSPTAVDGIESLGEVKTAEQTEAEINARMQDTIQRGKDWLEGNVANPVGMQIQLGDGRIATIEAMHEDGKSAIATLPDGTQFLVPKDILQRIVNNGHYADYKARRDAEASKREAEQGSESAPETATEGGQPLPEEVAPKEEERREYAQGDEFDVVVDGQKMHAEIVSPKDADGKFVVNVDDGESMRTLYVTPEELAAIEYREELSPKVEETRLATEDSSEKALERGAQLTEEHAPTALERIPRDEKGNAQFHDVDTETAWDGLVEMSGNEETAHKVAEASLANAEKKLKAAKALKENGDTPEELLRSIKENEKAVAEAEKEVDAWKAIAGEKSRREEAAKAEAERIATEKAEAERKAAEERERAEKEEKARIEAEKKETERIAAEKAEEEARVEAERKAEEERIAKQKTEEKTAETESAKEEAEKRMDDEEPKPVGSGVFGNIYNQFKGKVKEAFDFLMKHKGGDLLGVFHRKDVGDIDLVWGDENGGLAHILHKHVGEGKSFANVDEAMSHIQNIIESGKNDFEDGDKIVFRRGSELVTVRKNFREGGKKITDKNWVLTAYDKEAADNGNRVTTKVIEGKATPHTASTGKGSEKPGKKQEKQSVFDKAKEIADKEEKKRKAEAEDDSALGQATRAVGKKKKVNLFKYTASKIISHPVLRGVHYANGYAYASDAYIIFKEKADYPKEWEGTTRDKDGNLVDGEYPDAEKAIHGFVYIPDKEVESLPSKEVLDFAIAASKKMKGEAIPVAIDGIFFNAVNLKKFLEAVASKGMDKVVYRHPMLYATNGKDEIVMMSIVNTLEGALNIADRMEIADLPKEQIDAWKAHIEAADKKMSFDDFKKAVENAKKEGVRPTEADKQESKAEAEKQKVDKQGNPIDAEGRLITEKVEDISDLSDDDFNNPTRSVELPKIPKNVDDALGANGRPVIIKKNIFEKNGKSHGFTPKQSRKILGDALYNPDIVGQSQPSTKKTHWVAIKVDEKSPITILEVNDGKDNVEVVGWYTLDARNLERIKRQAEREGGELLVLSPKDKVESLPTPTSGLPTDKGSEVGGEKQEAEKKRPAPLSERIEDVGEKIGDARKDVWKEIIARVKNKKQGIEEALKKSSAGKLFSSLFDEKELLESGVSNEVVTFISAVKGSLGTKPRSLSKLKMWINKVLHQYDMCEQALENWESVKKKIDEWKYYSQPFYMYRAAMAVGGYESGRDVGNAELWQIADGYSDGKSVAGQWCVRKAGAYDGIYKTYEEAAEALKKFAGENAAVDGKGKRKEVKLAIYKRRTDGTMFIAPEGKPDVIIQDGFKTLYEASAYKKEHYAEMQERYRTLMDGIKPKFNENRERKGRDWRGGKDVSAEDFREAFDFRGVEFGNWMQQKDRRQALNECYDSLMDLAMVCGVSPKALSLGGKLAMAFGARGVGKFNAHYEPDKVVINLTKTKGAGSLAHEWFHAIDNYFNMQGWDEFATESTRNVERKEMAEAWKDLVRAINGSDYFKRSDKYARLKGSRYWIEPTELGARAFAVWVENRLSKYGTINDYLANNPRLVDEKASDAEKKYAPYPFDKDADWMDEKFGRLFEVMQERVDEETGKHILYSRNKAAGHEKTELTAEERELRDNLVERMRKGGLDVVTDSEEMQRVIDTENERTRMMGASSVREHRVYHGSGADFDAFDHSHMGEGEGAQAYGWGTYVTEVEGIGRTYAIQNTTKHNDALRALQHDVDAISDQLNRHRDDLKYDEEQLKRANEWRAEAELDYELFKDEAEELKEKYGESSPEYRNHLFNDIYTDEMKRAQSSVKSTEESIQYRKEKIAELEKALKDKQAEIDELPKEFPRHLYTVEIPDDNGSNYLDWNGHPAESLLKDVGSFLESEGFERVQDSPVRYEKGESTVVLNPNATGADLYAELREALGSDKKASQALAELGCIGIKYPADNMRGGRKDGAKNYVIFNENDAKITDHIRFLRTADGEVYGLVKDGRIYLDPKVATSETAVHEYTHLWGDMLRRKDSEQWNHTVKELKNSVLWEEVKELYPELKTDDEIADEVLSTFSGRRGAERLREEARRVAEGEGGVFTKAKAIETLERVKEAIARFWEGVARMFGINRYRSAEELADMAMKDLLDSKNPMKDESGMRKRGEVGETLATSGTYFSGGGLLEAGLKGVIDPKVAVEFSEKIAGVYADNHGNHIVVADVRDVDPKKLVGAVDGGEVQYFHASPVCKNFSKAKREGGEVELDKETALSTAEFIAKTRPKVVTIENVKGYRNSEALKIITDELTRQGYDWDADVYNTADYGGYTKRERLIVRAKRDGKLPPKPEKFPEELRKKGWYSAVEDLIPHLEEKKTGVPQGTDERLKNSGIDYRTIDKPLYVFGRGYANKTVGHAFADELLPTLTTGGGDIIIMPDGRVLKASPRVLARVTGLPDTYKMPETDQLSHTIVGNGIPTQLTEGVIAPLLDNAIPSAERATKRESVFDVADRVSQNLEERTRAMGSRVEKRMADVAQKLEGKELSMEQKAVVDVFSGKSDNQKFSVEREDGKKVSVVVRKGTETSAGTKHSLYRHYNTNVGTITTDDILLIPQIIKEGEIKRIRKGNEQYVEYTQKIGDKKLTTLMQIVNGKEVFNNFYSNKKGSELPASRNAESIDNTPEGAHNINSEPSAKVEDKSESPKLFGEEIIDDGKKGSDSIDRSVRENPKNEDKSRLSRKPGESIFDYASRVSDGVDRSVRERVSARDEYEKKVKSKGFQTKEALQNSMLGLQEFMFAIDHASGNKRYIEDIPDFENPILGENRLSSVNKEEMHQVAKTQFKPLMSAVAKLSGNGKESGELYDYMFAKHGLERDAVMRQREAQKEFDKYQKANPKGTKTIEDFVASLEGKDYAGLTALTAEDGRVKSIQSQIDAIDEQMKATDDQLLLRNLGGQKKRLKVDLLNAARDAADDIRKAFESDPSHDRSDINELWSRVNEVNGNTLRKLYESGMLTKEAYNDISSMYTNYIPMRGFDQTTSADAYAYLTHGDSAFNAPIKTAKGRSSKADNPIAYMQAMAESAIMQGNRNVLVKQKMLNFVRNHPSDLASVSDVWLQYDSVADEWKPVFPDNIGANDSASVVAKKMEAFEDKMKQMAENHPNLVKRSNEAPDIPYKVVEKGQLNEHQVLVKQNGKSYIITVNGSPRAAQAANGLTNPDTDFTGAVGKVLEGAETLNRQLSSLYTTFKPGFVGSNYVRDALYSNTMVYVKEGAKYGGSFNLNFAKYNPAEMANLYARYNKGSLDTSNETHRLFLEFMQNGGETGFVNLKQIEKRKSEIAKAIKRDGRISAAQILGGASNAVDFANRAVENSARFAAYVTSRRSGRSVGRSVYDAKEISVNFNRKGSGSKFMGAEGQTKAGNAAAFVSGAGRGLYIFWNAGLQGLTNFSRQIGRHPGKALTLAALLFGFGALMSYLGSDDDDDENNYFNLPKYIRRSNVCYKIGDLFVTIPLPVEYRAFYGLGELASSTLAGKESGTTKDIAKEAVSQISQLFPIDFAEGGGGLHALIPSAVKPIVEAETNTAWTGLPIYKDNDFNKNMPENTKVYKTTNGHLVEISRALNDATGGNKYKKGFIDINPAKMEYVLKGMLGGAFSFPDELVKTTEMIVGDREFDWRYIPIANRFVRSADERTEYKALNEQYYKAKEEADIVRQQYNGAMKEIKAGNGSYKDLLGEVVRSDDFQKMVLFDAYNKPIKKLNDTLKQLRMSSDYDEKAEKVIREKIASVQRAMINKLEKMDSVNK